MISFRFTTTILVTLASVSAWAASPSPDATPTSFAPQILAMGSSGSERAATYEDALARAKVTGKDIAVFQYGSDWNPCSTSLYQNLWSKDSFVKEVGNGFILLAIDYPEVVGGRAVFGRCTAERCGLTGFSNIAIGSAPPLLLEELAKKNPPPSEITDLKTEGNVPFVKRENGVWVVQQNAPSPAQDTLLLTLKATRGGQVLRLDFPTDESLPSGGPGRAGNAVISEVQVFQGTNEIKAEHAWGNPNLGNNFGPWKAVDGTTANTSDGWNLNGGKGERRTLLVSLAQPVPAGSEMKVKIACVSQWTAHIPGTVQAAVLPDADTRDAIRSVGTAQQIQSRNQGYTWTGWGKNPRLALLDAQGRPIAADSTLRIGLTSAQLATKLNAMRAKRVKRDSLWSSAEKTNGPAKAELLRQSLDALDVGRDPEFGRNNGALGGNNGAYSFVHQAIKEADPDDRSGATRWLGFSMGAWGQISWGKDNNWTTALAGKTAPTDADYDAAEACIDRELKDPRNKLLEREHIQHIMQCRYDLYLRKFKGDHKQDKLFEIQRQIALYDPNTFWGTGAIGYLGMHRRSPYPFLSYGWDAQYQLKSGNNTWVLNDAWMQIDHAGSYQLTMTQQSGKDAFKVTRIAVLADGKELCSAKPQPGEDEIGPSRKSLTIPFKLDAFKAGLKHQLKIECQAREATTESIGGFLLEPVLIEE